MRIYNNLTADEIVELWQERSAIMEDGGLTREKADKAAYFDIRRLIGNVPVPEVIRDAVRIR